MQITEISISYEATQSLGNYSNVRPGIRIGAHLDEGDDPEAVKFSLLNEARALIQAEIDEALISDDQPPRYYVGPRFMIMYNNETRRVVILPDRTELMHSLPIPGGWYNSASVRPSRRMRIDQAQNVAARLAMDLQEHNDGKFFFVIDCSDGDLSRLSQSEIEQAKVQEGEPEESEEYALDRSLAEGFDEIDQARHDAIATARRWLEEEAFFLDTETTGLDSTDQIVQIAVLDMNGRVLLDTLIKPTLPIPARATAIHGITDDMVKDAPGFAEIWSQLSVMLACRLIVTYNSSFDINMLQGDYQRAGLPGHLFDHLSGARAECAMTAYAEFYGEWNDQYGSFRWQKLGDAARQCSIELPEGVPLHTARADAELCRQIVWHMAWAQEAK